MEQKIKSLYGDKTPEDMARQYHDIPKLPVNVKIKIVGVGALCHDFGTYTNLEFIKYKVFNNIDDIEYPENSCFELDEYVTPVVINCIQDGSNELQQYRLDITTWKNMLIIADYLIKYMRETSNKIKPSDVYIDEESKWVDDFKQKINIIVKEQSTVMKTAMDELFSNIKTVDVFDLHSVPDHTIENMVLCYNKLDELPIGKEINIIDFNMIGHNIPHYVCVVPIKYGVFNEYNNIEYPDNIHDNEEYIYPIIVSGKYPFSDKIHYFKTSVHIWNQLTMLAHKIILYKKYMNKNLKIAVTIDDDNKWINEISTKLDE
jgi:hypothetical protein